MASGPPAATHESTRAETPPARSLASDVPPSAAVPAPVDEEWESEHTVAYPAPVVSEPDPTAHTAPTSRPPPVSQDSDTVDVDIVDDDIDFSELGLTPSIPPPSNGEELPGYAEEVAFQLKQEFGITLVSPTDCTLEVLRGIEKVLSKRTWLDDEDAMRRVIARLMQSLDPASYPLDGDWHEGPYKDVRSVFLSELSRHPKLASIGKELKKGSKLSA